LRETDTVARLGGDEFAVLLPRASAADSEQVARGLLDAVRGASVLSRPGLERSLTLSIGIALLDGEGEATADDVLIDADLAMYATKGRGGDSLTFSTDEQQARAEAKLNGHSVFHQLVEREVITDARERL
jgi:diguanylate cyclase (GGDEF)-like protein